MTSPTSPVSRYVSGFPEADSDPRVPAELPADFSKIDADPRAAAQLSKPPLSSSSLAKHSSAFDEADSNPHVPALDPHVPALDPRAPAQLFDPSLRSSSLAKPQSGSPRADSNPYVPTKHATYQACSSSKSDVVIDMEKLAEELGISIIPVPKDELCRSSFRDPTATALEKAIAIFSCLLEALKNSSYQFPLAGVCFAAAFTLKYLEQQEYVARPACQKERAKDLSETELAQIKEDFLKGLQSENPSVTKESFIALGALLSTFVEGLASAYAASYIFDSKFLIAFAGIYRGLKDYVADELTALKNYKLSKKYVNFSIKHDPISKRVLSFLDLFCIPQALVEVTPMLQGGFHSAAIFKGTLNIWGLMINPATASSPGVLALASFAALYGYWGENQAQQSDLKCIKKILKENGLDPNKLRDFLSKFMDCTTGRLLPENGQECLKSSLDELWKYLGHGKIFVKICNAVPCMNLESATKGSKVLGNIFMLAAALADAPGRLTDVVPNSGTKLALSTLGGGRWFFCRYATMGSSKRKHSRILARNGLYRC